MRMGPLNPTDKTPLVGASFAYKVSDPNEKRVPTFLSKNRSGFSGGFKIPEEMRKAKLSRKIQKGDGELDEDEDKEEKTEISKEEIMAALQLDASQGVGGSKAGTGSRGALMNDLLENMEKELEKLRRAQDLLKMRKIRAVTGEYHEDTEEEKK